jgi:N utilization substance protein A
MKMREKPLQQQSGIEFLGPLLIKEADQLAREKGLAPHIVFSCLEQAFQKVAKDAYGAERDIRVHIDRATGKIHLTSHLKVVGEVTDPFRELSTEEMPEMSVGQEFVEEIPLPPFNRVTVQALKSTLMRSIRDIERSMEYEEFKDRVGQIVSGVVKQAEGGGLILDIGRAEGIVLRNELIPRENYRTGDRVKAYIYNVKREARGPQVFLSRSHPGFLAKLFSQEVPEIYDGLIEIKAVARDPGSRAKVAIVSREEQRSFDAIGACVGVRGNRVNAVSQELQGEKIDIIPWSPELPIFVVNALTPAEVTKVIVEKKNHIKVVVPDHQQSIAIGRRGQNVKLAHQLTGINIEIVTESAEVQHRSQVRQELTSLFTKRLDVDELMAHFLVSEGFESIEELANSPLNELSELQGINEEIAQELKERAQEALDEEHNLLSQDFLSKGGQAQMIEIGLPADVFPCLLQHKVLCLKDLGELALDEFLDIIKEKSHLLTEKEWGELILKARSL